MGEIPRAARTRTGSRAASPGRFAIVKPTVDARDDEVGERGRRAAAEEAREERCRQRRPARRRSGSGTGSRRSTSEISDAGRRGSAQASASCRASARRRDVGRDRERRRRDERDDPERAERGVVLVRDARVGLAQVLARAARGSRPAPRIGNPEPAGAEREQGGSPEHEQRRHERQRRRPRRLPSASASARAGGAPRRGHADRGERPGDREHVDQADSRGRRGPSARRAGRRRSRRCPGYDGDARSSTGAGADAEHVARVGRG